VSGPTFVARVHAGLDEAGYGPLLGPLTYGFSAFRCARGVAPDWARLAGATTRDNRAAAERLVVADSKEVFDRTPRGMARLEATALVFLGARAPAADQGTLSTGHPSAGAQSPGGTAVVALRAPASGHALVTACPAGLAPDVVELARHPWYAGLPERLPAHTTADACIAHGTRLATTLEAAGLEVVDAGVRVVPVGALNRAFDAHGNKGAAHFALGGALVASLFERFGAEGLELTCDRLGGRMRYGQQLVSLLPWSDVRTLREDPEWSEYEVLQGERRLRIRFVEKGDRHWFAVALASCLAKYARELVMDAFNAHFARLDPSLAPTAGYVQDGRRWLVDSAAARASAGLAEDVLVRSR
jgi:hypothetical protein